MYGNITAMTAFCMQIVLLELLQEELLKDLAIQKMPSEIKSYLMWRGDLAADSFKIEIVQEKCSELTISDADSDVF